MEQADHLSELTSKAPKSDLDPLTIVETIMCVENLLLTQFVERGPQWLAGRLRQGLANRKTGEIRKIDKPDDRARRSFYALNRLKKNHPEDSILSAINLTVFKAKFSPVRLDEETEGATEVSETPHILIDHVSDNTKETDAKAAASVEHCLLEEPASASAADSSYLLLDDTTAKQAGPEVGADATPAVVPAGASELDLSKPTAILPSRIETDQTTDCSAELQPIEVDDREPAPCKKVALAMSLSVRRTVKIQKENNSNFVSSTNSGPTGTITPTCTTTTINAHAEHLHALIITAKEGDRDPLGIAATILQCDGLSLAELVGKGPIWLGQRLRRGLPHKHTGKVRNVTDPDKRARRIFYCLKRLKLHHDKDPLIPAIDISISHAKLACMPLKDEPPELKNDVRRWGVMSKQERGRETGDGRALDDHTRHTYAEDVRLFASAAKKFAQVGESFSVRSLSERDVVDAVLVHLDQLFPPAVVASLLAGFARVAIDLYGTDPEHSEHIAYLRTRSKGRFPDQALSEAACLRFEDLLFDPLKMQTIMDAPRAMMARAHAPSLRAVDRVARAARAVVAQLKLESVGLEATQAAELDADVHLKREGEGEESKLLLRLPDPRERGQFRWDLCTSAAKDLLTDWLELKVEFDIPGSLFFPSEADPTKPQLPRVAMAGLYGDFKTVTDEHLTFDEIKTLRCYKAVLAHPEKLPSIAVAACYKDPRSLARRLAILLSRRRGGGEAA